ncbi:hypothetical protein [Haloarchaeobius amylolyticus]|uniref:hypothetical protein n=1 Tax=Haloarchaeobius amylolyticus TaxID=1198296 RepID=UPI00226F5CCD|nr:hypothetical protein [Haloarchaeobius amylolyticus]
MDLHRIRYRAAVVLSLLVGIVGIAAGTAIGGMVGVATALVGVCLALLGLSLRVGTNRHVAGAFGLFAVVGATLAVGSVVGSGSVSTLSLSFVVLSLVSAWRGYQYYRAGEN